MLNLEACSLGLVFRQYLMFLRLVGAVTITIIVIIVVTITVTTIIITIITTDFFAVNISILWLGKKWINATSVLLAWLSNIRVQKLQLFNCFGSLFLKLLIKEKKTPNVFQYKIGRDETTPICSFDCDNEMLLMLIFRPHDLFRPLVSHSGKWVNLGTGL